MDDQNQIPQSPSSITPQSEVRQTPDTNNSQAYNSQDTSSLNSQQPNPPSTNVDVQQSVVNLSPAVVVSDHSPQNQNNQLKPKKNRIISAVIIVVMLLGGLGAVYVLYIHKPKSVTFTKTYTGTSSNKTTKATVKAPVTSTVNCGSKNCFTTYFQKCSPATLTTTSPMANVKYHIYGKQGNGCSMLFEYTSNPNPAWTNKPMTCDFDNSQSLKNSVNAVINDLSSKKNTYDCTGPLVAILQSQ